MVPVGPGRAEGQEGRAGDPAGRTRQTPPRAGEPRLQPHLGAASPQQVRGDEQEDGECPPVDADGPRPLPEGASAVHVADQQRGRNAETEEGVVDRCARLLPQQEEHHDPPTDRLVGAERLDEDGQRRDEQQVPGLRQHEPQ